MLATFEAAEALGISERRVRALVHTGRLVPYTFDGQPLVPRSGVAMYFCEEDITHFEKRPRGRPVVPKRPCGQRCESAQDIEGRQGSHDQSKDS